MRIQFKFSMWEEMIIPENLEESFKEWLENNPHTDPGEVYNWLDEREGYPDRGDINDSYEALSIADNDGQPTAELLNTDGDAIWDNVNLFNKETL